MASRSTWTWKEHQVSRWNHLGVLTSDVCPRPLDNAPPAPAVRSRQDKVNYGISEHGSFLRSSRGSESLLLASKSTVNFQNIMNNCQHRGSVCSLFLSKSHDKVSWVWSRASKLPVAQWQCEDARCKASLWFSIQPMCCTFTKQFLLPGRPAECAGWAIFAHAGHCAASDGASAALRISAAKNMVTEHSWELLMWFSRYQGLHQVIWICEMASVRRFDKVCGLILCTLRICSQVASLQKHARHLDQTRNVGETVPLRALEKHPASYGRSAVPGEISSSRTCFPCEALCSEMVGRWTGAERKGKNDNKAKMRQKQAKDGNERKMELEEFEPSENVLKASKTLKTTPHP